MKPSRVFPLLLPLLAACATLGGGRTAEGDNAGARRQLWDQAFDAYSRDSVRVSQAIFQRLVADHPRTHEGHEARYYLGVLSLDPRGNLDPRAADEHFRMYLADDSIRALGGLHRREATTLRGLAMELRSPCAQRAGGIGCDTTVVTRPAAPPPADASAAELQQARRQLRDAQARNRELQAELERIRNTLAPRPNPRD